MKKVLQGIPAAPGIGVGRVLVYRETEIGSLERLVEDAEEELSRYRSAIERFCVLLEEKADRIAQAAGQKQADIIRSQILMVRDPYLNGQIEGRISSLQCAEGAVSAVCGKFVETFLAADNELTRLRAADVRDLRDGMLRALLDIPETDFSMLEPGTVLVADELSPSAMTELDPAAVAGIVLRTGGRNSHCSILARALEIPTVVGAAGAADNVQDGEWAVVDGSRGYVMFSLSEQELSVYREMREEHLRTLEALKQYVGRKTLSGDDIQLQLTVNVGNESDILRAQEYGFDGVGLLRTEFLYLDRDVLPEEEEQFQTYRRMALLLQGKPLVIRTLDVGGDKELPALPREKEDNPFLGCRGVRLCLEEAELFRTQLKAILRAGACGNVRLLIPMVTGLGELRRVKALLDDCKRELRERGEELHENMPVGVMIETAAASLTADLLSREADFFSIGTNDLTQYTMAADRGNAEVAYLHSYYDPALLRSVQRVISCAGEAGIPVSVCGQAAADPLFLPVLLSFGLKEFSVQPPSILPVRRTLSLWTKEEADALTNQALTVETEAEVRRLLEEQNRC